jgi:hypothetical protein
VDYAKLIDLASKVSLAVVLMIIIAGGVTGYWVPGTTYREALDEKNQWRDLALKGTKLAEAGAPFSVKMMAGPPAPYADELTATRNRLKAVSEAYAH